VVELPLLGSGAPSALELDGDSGVIGGEIGCDGGRCLGYALSLCAAGVE
jgi:hypothetical protein